MVYKVNWYDSNLISEIIFKKENRTLYRTKIPLAGFKSTLARKIIFDWFKDVGKVRHLWSGDLPVRSPKIWSGDLTDTNGPSERTLIKWESRTVLPDYEPDH